MKGKGGREGEREGGVEGHTSHRVCVEGYLRMYLLWWNVKCYCPQIHHVDFVSAWNDEEQACKRRGGRGGESRQLWQETQ